VCSFASQLSKYQYRFWPEILEIKQKKNDASRDKNLG
jgi:hypothetical protein